MPSMSFCQKFVQFPLWLLAVHLSTQNIQVSEAKEFRRQYCREYKLFEKQPSAPSFRVWCYRGAVVEPKWKDVDTGNFGLKTYEI